MKNPTFAHGKKANAIAAIESGKIKYPAYVFMQDVSQYGFVNKENELETVGIPTLVGTLDEKVILSSLEDGIYQVKGEHQITEDSTTFVTSSYILAIVQTIDGIKKIRRITADESTVYSLEPDKPVVVDTIATQQDVENAIDENVQPEDDENIEKLFETEITNG
jgi:hypothetical protein